MPRRTGFAGRGAGKWLRMRSSRIQSRSGLMARLDSRWSTAACTFGRDCDSDGLLSAGYRVRVVRPVFEQFVRDDVPDGVGSLERGQIGAVCADALTSQALSGG